MSIFQDHKRVSPIIRASSKIWYSVYILYFYLFINNVELINHTYLKPNKLSLMCEFSAHTLDPNTKILLCSPTKSKKSFYTICSRDSRSVGSNNGSTFHDHKRGRRHISFQISKTLRRRKRGSIYFPLRIAMWLESRIHGTSVTLCWVTLVTLTYFRWKRVIIEWLK